VATANSDPLRYDDEAKSSVAAFHRDRLTHLTPCPASYLSLLSSSLRLSLFLSLLIHFLAPAYNFWRLANVFIIIIIIVIIVVVTEGPTDAADTVHVCYSTRLCLYFFSSTHPAPRL